MSEGRKLWTKDELILALNLYLKLPFGKMHSHTPEIVELAKIMGRTPASVSMRLGNFASVDPFHQSRGIKGLQGGLRQVQPIWDEFVHDKENLMFESEKILAEKEHQTIEDKFSEILTDIKDLKGESKIREVKTRVNQSVFRTIVLANYDGKCAITGLNQSQLLIASHIIPWADNKDERLNPRNGICLNPLHDKAFDSGLITITPAYKIKVSKIISKHSISEAVNQYFMKYDNQEIFLPKKFLPDQGFLEYHNKNTFKN